MLIVAPKEDKTKNTFFHPLSPHTSKDSLATYIVPSIVFRFPEAQWRWDEQFIIEIHVNNYYAG